MTIDLTFDTLTFSLEESENELISRQMAALRSHPHFHRLNELDLHGSARRNVQRTLIAMRWPETELVHDPQPVTSTVLHIIPDLDAQQVISAYRLAMGAIRDTYIELAELAGAPTACTMAGLRRIWDLTDSYSELLAQAHGQVSIDGELGRRERARFLRHALDGGLRGSEVALGSAQLGLTPDTVVRVLRVHVDGPMPQRMMKQIESRVLGYQGEPVIARLDGDLFALTTDVQHQLGPHPHLAALSEPVLLADLHDGYLRAGYIMSTARRFGFSGTVRAADLGLRSAILAVPATSEGLFVRYVQEVHASTPMASDLLHTVETFLRCQRRFQRTADELNMHVNSLRHRLERYRDITGADLSDTETIAEVWWALEYRRANELPS